MCLIACAPFLPKSSIYCLFPLPLWKFLRAIGGAVSQAAVLILPQIKLNSQLSCCAFFFLVGIFITENEKILKGFLWLNKEAE